MGSSDPPIFPDGDIPTFPREREIDRLIRAAVAAGASQVLLAPSRPVTFRVGTRLERPSAEPLSLQFLRDLMDLLTTPPERELLSQTGDLEMEIVVTPFLPCPASAFLAGALPHLVIQIAGGEVERRPALEEPVALELAVAGAGDTSRELLARLAACLDKAEARRRETQDAYVRSGPDAVREQASRAERRLLRLEAVVAEVRALTRDLRPSTGREILEARLRLALSALKSVSLGEADSGDGGAGVPARLPEDPPSRPRPGLHAPPPESPEGDPPATPA